MTTRLQFILIGLLGGFAYWAIPEYREALTRLHLLAPLWVLAGSFFFAALAMLAELGLRRAIGFAAGIAAVAAGLATLRAMSFDAGGDMLQTGHVIVALTVISTLPVPFALAFGLGGRAGLRDYRALFIASWNLIVRYLAAWLFVGVMVLALLLMAALLDLVGVHLLRDLLRQDLPQALIVGGTLGLGLSVVTEMADTVSPYLLLRLLRLLTPMLLVVVAVFVAAVPLRGLGALFGELSVASSLLATAFAAIALISVVVDQDDVEAAQGRVLTLSAQGLIGLLPVLAGLAIWALVLRIGQYGWTPERAAALALAAVVAGYALAYLLALATGRRWRAQVRRANVGMAVAVLGLAAVWLTPLISPEALAVRSQLARFAARQMTVQALPLWQMGHDWGRPGLAGVADLRAQAAGNAALTVRLDRLASADGRWEFERQDTFAAPERIAQLRAAVRLLPAGAELPEGLIEAVLQQTARTVASDCATGPQPGCVLALVDLSPQVAGPEAVFVDRRSAFFGLHIFARTPDGWRPREQLQIGAGPLPKGSEMIDALLQGPLVTEPVELRALRLGDWRIVVQP